MSIIAGISISWICSISDFGDLKTYVEKINNKSLNPYYLREPIIWQGQYLLNLLIKNPKITLFLTNIIFLTILYYSLRAFKKKDFIFLLLLCSFLFILGMQNVYRQWAATILLIAAIQSRRHTYKILLLAALTHNASLAFFPLAIRSKQLFVASLSCLPVIVYIGSIKKSSTNTGLPLEFGYLLVLLMITTIFLWKQNFSFNVQDKLAKIGATSLVILISTLFFSGSSSSERIGMMSLTIMLPFLIDQFKKRSHYLIEALIAILLFSITLLTPIKLFIFN